VANRRREDDLKYRNWFRSDRMFEEGGRWFFFTREGTIEGPCNSRGDAEAALEIYLATLDVNPVPTGIAPPNHNRDRFINR